jgi:hypothetical protein
MGAGGQLFAILAAAVRKGARSIRMIDDHVRAQAPVSLDLGGTWVLETLPPYRTCDAMAESLADLAASAGWFELAIDGRPYRFEVELGDGSDASIFRVDIRPMSRG